MTAPKAPPIPSGPEMDGPAAQVCEPCRVCGQPKLPRNATAWVLGQCYSGVSGLDAYNDGSAECYRLGYNRKTAALAKAEAALREIATPIPSVDMADPPEDRARDALNRIVVLQHIARAALSGTPTPSRPPTDSEVEAYAAMRMSDDANWGEFCGCCGVILSLESRDEECGPAHAAAQMIHAWLEKNPEPRAALGEARGTASGEEVTGVSSLDGTAGHTPGPWELSPIRTIGGARGEAPVRGATIRVAGAMPVRVVLRLDFGYGKPEDEANANLIVSAPDLLRENTRLRDVVERLGKEGERLQAGWMQSDHELTRARAAHLENAELLAKAQGRVAGLEKLLSEGLKTLRDALRWHPNDERRQWALAAVECALEAAALAPPPPAAPAKEEGSE